MVYKILQNITLGLLLGCCLSVSFAANKVISAQTSLTNDSEIINYFGDYHYLAKRKACSKQDQLMTNSLLTCEKYHFINSQHKPQPLALDFTIEIYHYQLNSMDNYQQLLSSADSDMGLTYAWDNVVSDQNRVYWIHAGCHVAKKNWHSITSMTLNFIKKQSSEAVLKQFTCRCGFGCQEAEIIH